jgi:hypothetical protein
MKKRYYVIFAALWFCTRANAQDTTLNTVNVYLNCNGCYQDFLRTEITWVNFVRDRFVSDVNLLITQINTGSGGIQYDLYFIGQKQFTGRNDTLQYIANSINTDDDRRRGLAQMVKLGLIYYVAHTPCHINMVVGSNNLSDKEEQGIGANPKDDPWKAWVYNVRLRSNLDGQKIYNNLDLNTSVSANKVTDKIKININAFNSFNRQRYEIDNELSTYIIRRNGFNAQVVKSINSHWSAGVFASALNSTFSNYDLKAEMSAAVEYDFFAYKDAQTKAVTLNYTVGYGYHNFTEETIYGKMLAHLPGHGLNLSASFTRKWGSASGALYSSQFLNDLSKYRYGGFMGVDIMVFKGLSLSGWGGFEILRNQINLRSDSTNPEDILLRQRELATGYSYWAFASINYRFGSIYNNVVNPRFSIGNFNN